MIAKMEAYAFPSFNTLILLSDMVYFDHIGAALFEPRADHQHNEITLLNKTFIEK